jgi:outer membrane lipoprotein-sorting protein
MSAESALFPVLEEHDRYTRDLLSGMTWLSGQSFIDNVHNTATTLNDYTVDTRLTGRLRDRLKEGGAKFFYKKNKRIRLEVTKGATNQGSVVVRREDGTVEGRGGGMLKLMKMKLQPDSRMLELPNGRSIVTTDFPTLMSDLKVRLKHGAKARIASGAVSGKLWKAPVKVVEIVEGEFDTVTDRIYFIRNLNFPVEWDNFKDGSLLSVTFFDNIKLNAGLDDNLFNL